MVNTSLQQLQHVVDYCQWRDADGFMARAREANRQSWSGPHLLIWHSHKTFTVHPIRLSKVKFRRSRALVRLSFVTQ